MLGIESFPGQSAMCVCCKKAMDNIYYACQSQGCPDWYTEQSTDAKKKQALIKAYFQRCPLKPSGRRDQFKLVQYMEEVRMANQVLFDEFGIMMNLIQYQDHMAKRENGSLDPDDATLEFRKACIEVGALVDELGKGKHKKRVWVHVTDHVMKRQLMERAKVMHMKDAELKKHTQADLDKMAHRLQSDHDVIGGEQTSLPSQHDFLVSALRGRDMAFAGKVEWVTQRGIRMHREADHLCSKS